MWNGLSRIKIYNNHIIFKLLKTIYIERNFQCTTSINFSFNDDFFFKIYFDTTLTFLLIHIFHFFFVTNVVLSFQKSITNFLNLFRIHLEILWWFPLKSIITTWIIKKLTILILNMALNFRFVCNPWENYKCDNPNYPPIHAFTRLARIVNWLQKWKACGWFIHQKPCIPTLRIISSSMAKGVVMELKVKKMN